MKKTLAVVLSLVMIAVASLAAQQQKNSQGTSDQMFIADVRAATVPMVQIYPLYGNGVIPNSKPGPDQEKVDAWGFLRGVSRPTIQVYLPANSKANGTSILVFPGGGYEGLSMDAEGSLVGQFFQDHGVAAFVVKYRLPSDSTMTDKSLGPLEDAQQAIRVVRQHAAEWKLDPSRVGVIGFSAGGHLASAVGTHFEKAYVDNPDQLNLRPDFMILVYPVIAMDSQIAHIRSRSALLGSNPSDERKKLFSNELHVSQTTPPTLILHAADDQLVDVDNSIVFFEALRHQGVPVEMTIFEKGEHGFFFMPRDRWESTIVKWMESNRWIK